MPLPTLTSDKHRVAHRAGGRARDTPPVGPSSAALGRAVRRLRQAKRASIELLAFSAGLHPTSVQKIERAERKPTWDTLCRLAAALELSVSALVEEAESEAHELERAGSAHRAQAREQRKHSCPVVDGGSPDALREHVVREQRERIMRALVEVLAERGFASATVGLVVTQAKVSTRTFYQRFDGLEGCLIAIMDSALEQAVAVASQELEGADCWQDGVRSALAAVLSYFDREPELARVCVVETLAGGPVVLAHRERLIAAFRLPVLQRIEKEAPRVSPLAAEGVMSLVLGILHAHIIAQKPGPFIELLGPLTGLTMAPYLGARRVQREIEQADELMQAILNGDSRWSRPAEAPHKDTELGTASDASLFPNLGSATARRLRECLLFLAEHPESSNREVGVGIDLVHQSQVSKLLAYILRKGLATKRSEGKGKRNAWRLTPSGEEMTQALSKHGKPSSHS